MARLKPEEEQAGIPVVTPPAQTTPTGTALPTFGPPSPLGFGDTALRGRSRFDQLLQSSQHLFGSGYWGHDFNVWIEGQQEDPNDPEFNLLLQWAKRNAKLVEERGLARQVGQKEPITGISAPEDITAGLQTADQPPGGVADLSDQLRSAVLPAPPKPVTPVAGVETGEEEKLLQGAKRRQFMAEQRTRFKGSTQDLEFLFGPEGLSPTETAYISTNGTTLNGPKEEYAKKSGAFVLIGSEAGASGATHDVYVYYKDAQAGVFAIPADQVKSIQKRTGLDETGYPQDVLQGEWNKAVEEAQGYARAGIRISVREIFDRRIAAAEKALKAGGGRRGGGGAREFVGEDPAEVAAIDYYRAMLQILGDISGVPTPGGAG